MALDDLELSLMAFPQSWSALQEQINVNLLLMPVGNPLKALGTRPQFAGTELKLMVNFIAGLDSLPKTTSPIAFSQAFVATPMPGALSLFNALTAKLPAGTDVTEGKLSKLKPGDAPDPNARIHKALPPSYTNAFPFEKAVNDDFVVGDGYGCAVRAQNPGQLVPPQSPPPKIVAWGQILSYVLRQPALALALGITYQLPRLSIPAATLKDGGWLFFSLDASDPANPYVADWQGTPDKVKSYAARIPKFDVTKDRRLFAATLFPVVKTPGSNLTDAQFEAEIYDDGFAQVVHCNQPTTVDAATGSEDQIAPGAEAGIQIGWDDEQVTVWFNRQIDLVRDRVGGTTNAPEAPLGVQGYRVDVRKAGAGSWSSLCNVTGDLPFSGNTSNGSGATPSGELWVSPAPVRPVPVNWTDPNPEPAWLPLYFSQWRGSSLVVHDDTISKITPGQKTMPSSALTADLSAVPELRYGEDYEFRIRFVDLTGGGPASWEESLHPGYAPTGETPFLRHLPPKSLEVQSAPPPALPPAVPDAVRTIKTLTVRRPRIGYPEAIFAGVDPNQFVDPQLTKLITDAKNAGRALGVPDPDVDRFEVRVEARIPAHDTGTDGVMPGDVDGPRYRIIYSNIQHFGAGPDPAVTLVLNYVDTPDIAKVVPPADDSSVITVPTARDVRIRLIPLSQPRSNYYGTPEPPVGLATDFIVRAEAADESDIFPFDPPVQLMAFYFQPGNNLTDLLAQSHGMDLRAQNLSLSAGLGRRIVFGSSGALRHTLSSDASSITFANQAEFLGHWIVAFAFDLDRDWTWDGFAEPAMEIYRDAGTIPVGTVTFPRVVSSAALGGLQTPVDRSTTRIIFFDAISPQPAPGFFPDTLNPHYTVKASFTSAAPVTYAYADLTLPITTPPTQTPKVVATGIAESPFKKTEDYSQTFPRDRYLWIEFDQPLADPDDAYYARVLGYGPDPLLAASLLPPSQPASPDDPPLAVDPELVRFIFFGESPDFSGLDAMTELIPELNTGSPWDGRHFILPLPDNITPDALELFGFWTYELRVGHKQKWSTAQGRYGRPLRLGGVQHPVPQLTCVAQRYQQEIVVSAPYATTVVNGVRVYDLVLGDPQTVLWFMLYAQVLQLDGSHHRNVLLGHLQGFVLPDAPVRPAIPGRSGSQKLKSTQFDRAAFFSGKLLTAKDFQTEQVFASPHTVNREPRGFAVFPEKEVEVWLSLLGLPRTSPLSVLAVEVLPGPLHERTFRTQDLRQQAEDPLGRELGTRRVLRTSPLTPVPPIC